MVVLWYINTTTARCKTFVANRVAQIHQVSTADQWRHVGTKLNPADDCRGLSDDEMIRIDRWLQGPAFLSLQEIEWPQMPICNFKILDVSEVKKVVKLFVLEANAPSPLEILITRFSCLHRLIKAAALLLRFRSWLQSRKLKKRTQCQLGS